MFAAQKTKKAPSRLTIDDLDAVTVGAFLSYLDNERHNSTATRNARLAAIHSFYRYALPLIPDRAHTASQVLAIPQRRHDRAIVSYLTSPETNALLAAPDCTTRYGRRDHALLLTTVQTGLRVSEVTGLTIQDITTTTPGAAVHTTGKGRKERVTPLTRQTAVVLRAWLPEAGRPRPAARRSPHTGEPGCLPTPFNDSSPNTPPPPHSAALHADMTIKERALARVPEPNSIPGPYRPADELINFLERL
jgi:site-specific recombinase XerD